MRKNSGSRNSFLLIFFGIIILAQLIGIAMRGFRANAGQLIGIAIGLIGYGIIMSSYLKERKIRK